MSKTYEDLPIVDDPHGAEGPTLIFALDRVHRQLAWKTGGLDLDQLRRPHPPSGMTLGWVLQHLAMVEDRWTAEAMGVPPPAAWDATGWVTPDDRGWVAADDRADGQGRTAGEATTAGVAGTVPVRPEQIYERWYDAVERSRRAWLELVAGSGLDVELDEPDDYRRNRRRVLIDIIEENLLHTGHASLLREAVDGLTGNDPP